MKAILFDFGGTLDTDGIHWSENYWDAYEIFNVSITKQQYEESYIFSENNMAGKVKTGDSFSATLKYQITLQIEYLTNKNYLHHSLKDNLIEKIHKRCISEVLENVEIVKRILLNLRTDYLLGVVSNFYGNLDFILRDLRLRNLFDILIDSTLVGVKKPDPQIFQIALDRIGVTPPDTIVIGDSYDRDIQPAKILGCTTIWLDGKSWIKPKETTKADYKIISLKEVENILVAIKQRK